MINHTYYNLKKFQKEFYESRPFPYLVMDNFIEKSYFSRIKNILDKKEIILGKNFNSSVESNKSISLNSKLPTELKLLDFLNSDDWIKNLNALTRIPEIFPITTDNETVANYHEMRESGNLAPHVDHSHEPSIKKPHVLNIIVYLSDNWKMEYGGNTLFYDKKGKKIEKKIDYKENRAVLFLHTPYSFHGVEKIKNSKNEVRKTLYMDYYSNSLKPFENINLDFSSKWFKHGTTFIFPNKLDYFKFKNLGYTKTYLHYKVSEFINSLL
jgi:Rps23 Pro-64 3,4-dihydroxylase Tpa1-like proline 4-hydroxylase